MKWPLRWHDSTVGALVAFIVRNCARCGVANVQHMIVGSNRLHDVHDFELAAACQSCAKLSVYVYRHREGLDPAGFKAGDLDRLEKAGVSREAVRNVAIEPVVSEHVPPRVRDLYVEAAVCRAIQRFEAAGAMYRKTLDVATKVIYSSDSRLTGKKPADALRPRIRALGEMKILDTEVVELADVAALDGNDAAHDVDPYTADEALALEDLTADLLDRLFVRPAKLAAVRAKQVAAGQREA